MSSIHDMVRLMRLYRLPTFRECRNRVREWWRSDSKWFAISIGAHGVVLLVVAFIPMTQQVRAITEAALTYESAQIDTTSDAVEFAAFDLGEAPIEPAELSTETLTAIVDAPLLESGNEAATDERVAFDATTDGGATGLSGVGDLSPFSMSLLQDGPGGDSLPSGPGQSRNGNTLSTGGPGSFGSRSMTDRAKGLANGGTQQTERAVQGALVWFSRHQNPDGSWSLHDHACRDGKCTCGGTGDTHSNSAATAFALLPFLAAGQTHESDGPFKPTIARGLNWMVSNQDKNTGSLAARGDAQVMYTHGLATIALVEAYGLSKDKRLLIPAQAAVNFIQNAQGTSTGSWTYGPDPNATSGDTSVFGWQLMALKSAQMAGLQVNPKSLQGAQKWLTKVSKGKAGGLFCYNADTGPAPTMTSVGLLGTQYLGAQRKDPRITEGMNYLMSMLPNPRQRNCYYWYYATQVMHNLPGPEWDRWNREMRRVLVDTQEKDGCAMGSWDPNLPTPDPWGKHGGRVMVSSIAALTLEVYYRYLPLYNTEPDTMSYKKTASK